MDYTKVGNLIRKMRIEKGLTQKEMAEIINLSDKTISKWERGVGLPDITILKKLSEIFGITVEKILEGELEENSYVGGNMKKVKYFVCKTCGNISVCTGNAEVSCCGRKLEVLVPKQATEEQMLTVGEFEDNWRITSNHPMDKESYVPFIALASDTEIDIVKLYPEWNLAAEFNKYKFGNIIWYSPMDGLLFQKLKRKR